MRTASEKRASGRRPPCRLEVFRSACRALGSYFGASPNRAYVPQLDSASRGTNYQRRGLSPEGLRPKGRASPTPRSELTSSSSFRGMTLAPNCCYGQLGNFIWPAMRVFQANEPSAG